MRTRALSISICTALMAVLALQSVLAAPLAAPAVNGDGLMDVAPMTVAYGTATTYTFTFTANNDFQSGSQVVLIIPTDWTTPIAGAGAGHVSVSSGTCTLNGSPPWQIGDTSAIPTFPLPARPTILVDLTSCLTNDTFTINYNGSPPGVPGSPFTFDVYTDIGPGGEGLVPITAVSPSVTIEPRTLTVSGGLTPASKVYDGSVDTSVSVGSPSLVGVLPADVGSVSLDSSLAAGVFVDRNFGTAKVVDIFGLALTGAKAGNYALTQPTRAANITKSPITITAGADTKTYDGTTASAGVPTITSVRGIQAGDSAPAWTQSFNNRDVGTNLTLTPAGLVLDGNSGLNYAYTYASASTGTINKRPITVTAATSVKQYDRNTSSGGHPTLTSGAIQTGDTEPVWTQTYDTASVGTNKDLTPAGLVVDANGGNNYAYTFVHNTTGVITAKPLTVSSAGLTPANKVYDGTTATTGTTGSPTLVGVLGGDTVTLVTGATTYTFSDKNAGNGKLVHVSGLSLGGAAAGNYSLSQPDRAANISPRPLGVTAVTDSREYDGTNHSNSLPSVTAGAIQPGDVEPVWTQTFADKHVGSGKALIPAGSVVDGNGGNNYAYTFVHNTTGVITPRPVTVTALADTKTYDGTTHSADTPNHAPGLVGSDTAGFAQAFNNKHVGTGKTMTPSGVVNDGNSGNNYSYTYTVDTTGVITPLAITVTAVTDNRDYDGTTDSSGVPNISPALVGTDTAAFQQVFDTKEAGTLKTLTPSGVVNDGNGGANYIVTFAPDVNGVILPKPITVTAEAKWKAAGAADPALTYSVNPALFGTDSFTGALTRAAGEALGLHPITQGDLTAGPNYSITYAGADLLIGYAISGNAGAGGAILTWTDTTSRSTTADGGGNYSVIVSPNWTGTVTPSLAGYVFTPADRTYTTPAATDLTAQDYSASPLVTVVYSSIGSQDGWVLESSQTSNQGGTAKAGGTTLRVGDDANRKQYRSVLSFDTSGLPGAAIITNLDFKVMKQAIAGGGDPVTSFQGILVDLRKGTFGAKTLEAKDFQAKATSTTFKTFGPFKPVPDGLDWYTITLPSDSHPYINTEITAGGLTQLRVRFKLDDNNNSKANYLSLYSGDSLAENRPQLIITYYVP